MTAAEIIRAGQALPARPWPRYALGSQAWRAMVRALALSPEPAFEALWADAGQVYALFTRPEPLLASAPVEAGVYAALSPSRPEATLFERAVGDLWGHLAADAVDARPWLDHGSWPVLRPMLPRPIPNSGAPEPPELRPPPAGAAAIRRGPIDPELPGPALLQLALRGETLVQVDARLGFGHRGALALLRGRIPAEAVPLVARLDGTAPVAHGLAFARAAEAALGAEPPPRAIALRAVAAALERLAMHLHALAEALAAAGDDATAARDRREAVLGASQLAFGHRLLMGVAIPGGVARELTPEGAGTLLEAVRGLAPPRLGAALLRRAGGLRLRGRAEAVGAEVALLTSRLADLPGGAVQATLPRDEGEGLGRAEGPRGTVWHWLQVRDGRIAEMFAADPACRLWPRWQSEAVGAPVADIAVLAAAFGLATGGVDL